MEDPCRAWKAFATCALPLFPVLIRQMEGVTKQTEAAALDLMTKLQAIAQRAGLQADEARQVIRQAVGGAGGQQAERLKASADLAKLQAEELSKDVGQIVMALQFQDITRQKLEHVAHAIVQLRDHLQHLADGRPDQDLADSLSLLKDLEHRYTMDAERRIHAEANGLTVEPAKAAAPSAAEDDSVTLF